MRLGVDATSVAPEGKGIARVQLGTVNLLDVYVNFTIRPLLDIHLELVDFRALASDDDARTGREDRHAKLVGHPLDLNAGYSRVLKLRLEIPLQFEVLVEQPGVVALGKPS